MASQNGSDRACALSAPDRLQAGVGLEPVKDLLNVVVDGCPADTVIATIGGGKGPKGVAAGVMPTK